MSRKHGRSSYVIGCRCEKCVSDNRVYQLNYLRSRIAKGIVDEHGKLKARMSKIRGRKPQE